MRFSLAFALVASFMVSASPALAVTGYQESLIFHTDLEEMGAQDYDLCILQRDDKALWMSYRTSPQRYVLGPDNCDGEQYMEIPSDIEAALVEADMLPPLDKARFNLLPSLVLGALTLIFVLGTVARVAARRN